MSEAAPVLAVIGDIHANFARLDRVLDRIDEVGADGILLVGDLACAGHARVRSAVSLRRYKVQVRRVLAQVHARGRPMAFVPGNHDLRTNDDPANVDGRLATLGGLRVVGIGGAGPDLFGFAYEWPEDRIRALRLPAADILLCHAPPRDTALDLTHSGLHVGSDAIAERARQHTGVLLCGHIHEAPGVVEIGDCMCMNVGALGQPFGRTVLGFIHGLDRLVWEDLDTGNRREWRRHDSRPARHPAGHRCIR
ncbi:MAG: hypothetical protein GXP62_03285 [Oligoflexia bacterium]|nr:hypothetical protein [Oligoflexia bacterium]